MNRSLLNIQMSRWLTAVLLIAHSVTVSADEFEQLQTKLTHKIRPIFENACGDCHWGLEANAGLNLDAFASVDQVLDSHRQWSKVLSEIENDQMPPVDAEPLAAADKTELVEWINRVFKLVDCSSIRPGKPVLRKLNRTEYRNSIRDLLGIDYQPAKHFPGDDIGYGFDNIADVLSLPPVLMEKYLRAAEEITRQVIVDDNNPLLKKSIAGASFEFDAQRARRSSGRLILFTEETVSHEVLFPVPGKYSVSIEAYGDQGGKEWVQMSLLLNGEAIDTVDVKSRSRKPSTHRFELEIDAAGKRDLQIRFENDFYEPRLTILKDRNLHVLRCDVQGPSPGQPYRDFLEIGSSQDVLAAQQFIAELAPRAYRRPLTATEEKRLVRLFERSMAAGQSYIEAIRTLTQAVLVSPHFLYMIESPVQPGQIRPLSDHERATALSFFIWSSTPDDRLLDLAQHQQLNQEEVWEAQVKRLFDDRRSSALVDNFVAQWFNLRILADVQPDENLFPSMNPQLLRDMATETRLVVAEIIARDLSILELLKTDFTFLNRRLAEHYGIPDVVQKDFQKVSLQGFPRSGILTHASILTLTSNPTRTSPVKRGKWIMENILGDEPPPPDPEVPPLDDRRELTGSLRERMEQHRSNPSCASCHTTMDALGFALEHYDAVGRWRDRDDGHAINAQSTLPDGTHFDGAAELQMQLQSTFREKFIRCFAEKLLIYALGRGLKYYDRCTVDKIVEAASKEDYTFFSFVRAITNSDAFLKRSGQPIRKVRD